MKLNRKWVLVIALLLSVAAATAGTLAYLTDRDTEVNTFTLGNVDIEVEEDYEQDSPLLPGVDVEKKAGVKNNHETNEAWVWMTVSVPTDLVDYIDLEWLDGAPVEAETVTSVHEGYTSYVVMHPTKLLPGTSTPKYLQGVKLSKLVDFQGGEYGYVENGEFKPLPADLTAATVIVDGFAVQPEGFATVEAAFEAYAEQWGEASGEEKPVIDGRVEYNGVIYDDIYVGVEEATKAGGGVVKLLGTATMDKTLEIPANITIEGEGHTYSRADGFTGTMFNVASGATLTVNEMIIDGAGATATGNLIATTGSGSIVLNEGTVLKNNNGAHAVSLATRGGGTLTLNGAEISNNSSDSGAIWGGGHIIVNEGSKINNNSSTGSAGAIRMVSSCNLTMNGGEISNNTAVASGGAIYGYGASTYNFNGGKMSGNTAAVGGAMYTGDSSTINISGSFELCNNTADDAGALRLSNRTAFNMSGGKVYGNESKNSPDWDGFYGWNPGVNITGGELADDVTIQGGLTPTVGGNGITGIIHFDLSTNHNTAYLAADFGSLKFAVAAGDNFAAFNFKPATGYSYAEGDEAKLICMNDGYSTYWDTTTQTFKLKAD